MLKERAKEQTWFALSRSFVNGKFSLNIIPFKSEDKAWNYVESELDTSNSQTWLLSEKEIIKLKELISSEGYSVE